VVAGQLSPEPGSRQAVSPADLQSAIDNLGKLDYDIRTSASRVVRRSQASLAVPALVDAAAKHTDGYVQYRALVLLTGFNDSRTTASLPVAMASPNDRLRAALEQFAVAGASFERATADVLFDVGTSSGESTQAPVSLAVAAIALRRTPAMLSVLEARPDRNAAVALLAEGFDGLTEDYEKERFFASVRRSYREAAEGSPRRALIQTLIEKLEF
jgi:hypothetical protein